MTIRILALRAAATQLHMYITQEGCSKSNSSSFTMQAHAIRGDCWWDGSRGWTFLQTFHCILLAGQQMAAELQFPSKSIAGITFGATYLCVCVCVCVCLSVCLSICMHMCTALKNPWKKHHARNARSIVFANYWTKHCSVFLSNVPDISDWREGIWGTGNGKLSLFFFILHRAKIWVH